MYITKDIEKLNRLNNYINECVSLKLQADSIAEQIKEIRTLAKDDTEVPTKDFNQLVEVEYDKAKVETKIEELSVAVSTLEIIKNQLGK